MPVQQVGGTRRLHLFQVQLRRLGEPGRVPAFLAWRSRQATQRRRSSQTGGSPVHVCCKRGPVRSQLHRRGLTGEAVICGPCHWLLSTCTVTLLCLAVHLLKLSAPFGYGLSVQMLRPPRVVHEGNCCREFPYPSLTLTTRVYTGSAEQTPCPAGSPPHDGRCSAHAPCHARDAGPWHDAASRDAGTCQFEYLQALPCS